ncbi:MAG: rod shape-determining protein [Candidatus Levybacteria bacterium RIFCSPHIGHO2_02_FULL_39_36]|nr:MAG: Rod shape-determining protein mreB [Candidatus Levybacteria bacterium GW2011_GWA1_39_11]KKR48800.1 MAG: Rod shape-determining protein mreB [Candidatus Levybacteria bacterium GW2011_GWA2_40_16]OGH25709.1 MAG: rod shape-determining protein [Candidatus Levybacteria bacterium RIFCSPHIGHO2_12_FULL_39_39]OGH28657.1 MAG: rod shape-determining protein [Candidatus Levybacteria bacterium RIFCSPHIGHO2_02_FULL_39_36]OGH45266.1 MAG: rod shape-determining protein [Candidatus Levybacteria bacterium RI
MLSKRIGIDLGTANVLVYLAGEGVVLNEPTVVAVRADDNKVVAVGAEAKEMLGRTPGNIIAMRPLKDGVIADYVITQSMLSYFIDKVCGRSRFFKPEVMVCIPSGVTQVEKRAVLDACMTAGAGNVYLIEEPLAAAIGAKIPIAQAAGHMILDSGGGTTDIAVISLGGVVVHKSIRVAGNKTEEAIANYIRKRFNLLVGERTAEEIKVNVCNAIVEPESPKKMETKGRDSVTGLPRAIEITEQEVNEAIQPILKAIISAIREVFEITPPELASDIIEKGIVLSGGTALLKNLDNYIAKETGVPAYVAEDPLFCVVRGVGVALENLELYKKSINRD